MLGEAIVPYQPDVAASSATYVAAPTPDDPVTVQSVQEPPWPPPQPQLDALGVAYQIVCLQELIGHLRAQIDALETRVSALEDQSEGDGDGDGREPGEPFE